MRNVLVLSPDLWTGILSKALKYIELLNGMVVAFYLIAGLVVLGLRMYS
jgi:hypothetical protein